MEIKIIKPNDWDFSPNSIIHGDCIQTMQSMPEKSVDMIIADLPYGTTQIEWDTILPLNEIWSCYERVCKPNAAIVLTATQPFASKLISSKEDWFKYEIIWVKNKSTGHLNAKKQPMRNHESILVFYQKQPTYNPQMTNNHEPMHYAVNNKKKQTNLYGKFNSVESRTGATDRYPQSVIYFDVVNASQRIHETQKPIELFSYLIKTFSNPGDIILDPVAGSLTTAFSCILNNRKYICIEKEEKYIKKSIDSLTFNNIFEE